MNSEGHNVTSVIYRSIPDVANFCRVSEKTVQRAIRKDGIVIAVSSRNPNLTATQRT